MIQQMMLYNRQEKLFEFLNNSFFIFDFFTRNFKYSSYKNKL